MPLISVIIPVYKVEKYLTRCVDSVLNQTFKDFEIVLVNDGSPDQCPKICDKYASEFDNIISLHKENGGLSDARNYGIDYVQTNSDSEFITFVDSDDWIHPQYLEILFSALIKTNADVSCSKLKRTNDIFEMADINDYNLYSDNMSVLYLQGLIDITAATAKLFKKVLFQKMRFPKGKWFEDDWIIPILLFSGVKAVALRIELYYYFYNPNGITGVEWTTQKLDACLEVLRYQNKFFLQNKSYDVLSNRLRVYVDVFEKHSQINRGIKRNIRYVRKRRREIRRYVLKNRRFIPEIQHFGYEAWAKRKIYIIKNFYQDINTVSNEKGKIYAFFWKIKKYHQVYKEIMNDT